LFMIASGSWASAQVRRYFYIERQPQQGESKAIRSDLRYKDEAEKQV